MAYKALYREWRPQTFADVVGQRHVVTTLTNALRQGRLAHAYLFSGPRGTGKTTMAKLLAKAVNCERPVDGFEPCNACPACVGITAGAVVDVTEMDAASNRGVDEIRSLLEQVQYTPTEVPRKVYIIDEVHMLTTEAFNALLKTLEEPPAYCLFVLATTELHKVPATIASRCQRFDFGRAPADKVVDRLRLVADGLDAHVEEAALWQIARASEGGLRDALSLLDQALAFSQDKVDVETVSAVLGGVPSERLGQLYATLLRKDVAELLTRLAAIWEGGADAAQVVTELIAYGRDAILLKNGVHAGGAEERVKYDPTFAIVTRDASIATLLSIIERLARLQAELRFQSQPQLVVEVALIAACEDARTHPSGERSAPASEAVGTAPDVEVARLRSRVEQLERLARQWQEAVPHATDRPATAGVASSSTRSGQVAPSALDSSRAQEVLPAASALSEAPMRAGQATSVRGTQVDRTDTRSVEKSPQGVRPSVQQGGQRLRAMTAQEHSTLQEISAQWSDLLEDVKQRSVQSRAWLLAGRPEAVCDGALWVVFKGALHAETVMKSPHAELIAELLAARFGMPLRLQAVTEEAWSARQALIAAGEQQAAAVQEREPWVEKVVEWFGEERVTIQED